MNHVPKNGLGAPLADGAPKEWSAVPNDLLLHFYNNAQNNKRKSPNLKAFREAKVRDSLSMYLNMGLTPIPLKGKIPIVKWRDTWHPTKIVDLEPYIKSGANFGVKTGPAMSVIDFDSVEGFVDFVTRNIQALPPSAPIVRTGRGFHIWFKPVGEVRNQPLKGVDIKGEGGQVVVPPSIHPATGKEYVFIRAPKDNIPELDLNTLDWGDIGKVNGETIVTGLTNYVLPPIETSDSSNEWLAKRGLLINSKFDYSAIQNGVKEGNRHSMLVQYAGLMAFHFATKEEILDAAFTWNTRNKPPLSQEEVINTIEDIWRRYGRKVTIKTQRKQHSVLIATDQPLPIRVKDVRPTIAQQKTPEDRWQTESPLPQGLLDACGKRRSIIRRDTHYMSIRFYCGRWDCLQCAAFFKKRWIGHLKEVTKDGDLYLVQCKNDKAEWDRTRKSLNRTKAEYFKIRTPDGLKILTNKQIDSAEPFQADIQKFLETNIPSLMRSNPISTSRGWKRAEHKKDPENKPVVNTWLPLAEQVQIAKDMGAKINSPSTWDSPAQADAWEAYFVLRIAARESEIVKDLLSDCDGLIQRLEHNYRSDFLYDLECSMPDRELY